MSPPEGARRAREGGGARGQAGEPRNYLNPDGTVGPPTNAATPVTLAFSDGNTITIADQKVTPR